MRLMPKGTRWREIFKCRTPGCPAIPEVTEKDVFIERDYRGADSYQLSYLCPKCKRHNYICNLSIKCVLDKASFIAMCPLFRKLPLTYEEWLKKQERAEKRRKNPSRKKTRNLKLAVFDRLWSGDD